MARKYFSVDIEASGLTPGKYSMLSFGVCVVGETQTNFYRELKPISTNYVREAMEIGCLGLECLAQRLWRGEEYNPRNKSFFSPEHALKVLDEDGLEPKVAMEEFAAWTRQVANGATPVLVASPIAFDGMFLMWYFNNFYNGENPYGFGGIDITSMLQGFTRNLYERRSVLLEKSENIFPHNALQDAIFQAKQFEELLRRMRVETGQSSLR